MKRVAVFASTRADLFPLSPVLAALARADDLEAHLLASGTIGNEAFGDPMAGVDLSGVEVHRVAADLQDSGDVALAEGGTRIAAEMTRTLAALRPDAVVVLGDRWELLYAVPPVVLLGMPLVHLHGGEVTEGAIDDRVRHAVTKLADVHCVSTPAAAARVRQLGEPPDRVVVTGAPGLDRFAAVRPATDEQLAEILGAPLVRPFALVTYHPPTAGGPDPAEGSRNVLAAVATRAGSAVVTHPGLDRGRDAVLDQIRRHVRRHPHLVDVEALGRDYLPVLAAADVVVGNSSSGVLEAATFGVPVVDVGDRQRGRERGTNVITVPETQAEVEAAIDHALSPEFRERARQVTNVYGDGAAAPRIVDAVRRAARGGLDRKSFVDLPKPVLGVEVTTS